MQNSPNIFSYATSELSQDAILCYWAAWAHPGHAETAPLINARAQSMVKRMANRPIDIRNIEVERQIQNIDVVIAINDDLIIVVEDKTETAEHSDQMSRYRSIAERLTDSQGEPWGADRVTMAYVKTGNAPRGRRPSDPTMVMVGRRDLLSLLGNEALPDQILEQFRQHLIAWEIETQSFESMPLTENRWTWDRRGQQGFYMWLEECLGEGSWHYVANPSGGFLGYYWNWRWQDGAKCQLYLQIEHCRRLQIRIANVHDESGLQIRAPPHLRYRLLAHILELAPQICDDIKVVKSGRYQPGIYGGVADLQFGGKDTYLALDDSGALIPEKTLFNLRVAMALVDLASSTPLQIG